LTVPPGFDLRDLDRWVARIGSPQVKTLTRRLLDRALAVATERDSSAPDERTLRKLRVQLETKVG